MIDQRIVATILTRIWTGFLKQYELSTTSIIEHRLDAFSDDEIEKIDYINLTKKIIATCRSKSEGGHFTGNYRNQMNRLKLAIKKGATFVDIELDLPRNIQDKLINYARGFNVKIIISKHFYEKTPEMNALIIMGNKIRNLGADISKIVITASSFKEVQRILNYQLEAPSNTIAFAMGSKGSISRIVSLLYGAPFTYAYLDRPVAEGQLSVSQMQQILNYLRPDLI